MNQYLRGWQSWRRLRGILKTAFSPKYLLITNVTISAGLSGASDISVQKTTTPRLHAATSNRETAKISKASLDGNLSSASTSERQCNNAQDEVKPNDLNLRRLTNMIIMGGVGGVVGHYWYIWLDSRKFIGTTLTVVAKKTLIDQIVLSPVFILLFFFTLGYLDGDSTEDIVAEIKCKGLWLFVFDWLVYPPAQFINFLFLPTRLRVLYDCVIAYLVDIYYCHVKFDK